MSRAYRIQVRETLKRVFRTGDAVATDLELLEILPKEEMAALLKEELQGRGFSDEEGKLQRTQGNIIIKVDPATAQVTVEAECEEEVTLSSEQVGNAYDDAGPNAKETREKLRETAKEDLIEQAERQKSQLQSQTTDQLETELQGLREELDQVVNRVTAEALKRKAAQLGNIKELSEDEETGSMTIVVEL
ncbi:Hypothetical protein PBC10988_17410 [Planctomycetales bacterium 10988]|nr:Hypothetical protein PBC10988_17410 [Planctomycetales bacterium 10988]